ncbi:MAG: DEAD/DEAH box helicase [Planctomycetaceae bacterium]
MGMKSSAVVLERGSKLDLADAKVGTAAIDSPVTLTAGGIPIRWRFEPLLNRDTGRFADVENLRLHLDHARLNLLRGFDQLLCLEGLHGVEQLPHQIETVRKVLRRFRGRVLLADEVGLGKTIEACLLLREYLLRGLVRRVLILVPNPLVSQWHEELLNKFGLEFTVPPKTRAGGSAEFWKQTDRVLVSLSWAKMAQRSAAIAAVPWDLVIVDEAHHCKNRNTRNWQLVNSLSRRHMFLLTATPVQNDLVELFNLLTLLEPGHLRTEKDFKKQFVKRGNPRDPRNRERLRSLLGEVMVRNTRSLVQMDLPPRYAQTIQAVPGPDERRLYELMREFLRPEARCLTATPSACARASEGALAQADDTHGPAHADGVAVKQSDATYGDDDASDIGDESSSSKPEGTWSRMQLQAMLSALGSHPAALAVSLERTHAEHPRAKEISRLAARIGMSAKDEKLLELLRQSHEHKALVFVNARATLHHLQHLLTEAGIAFSTFSGEQSDIEKDAAVEALRSTVPVMLCTDSGGEGRNLQFADTLINYDLPWNPMKIEQRIGRVHRIGQTRDVFVFNLCTSGSLEERILRLLSDKIRMFELVVGEVGSILGNLDEGEDFESLVLNLWLKSPDESELDRSFDGLADSLLDAQEKYVQAKELDEALFGDDYE